MDIEFPRSVSASFTGQVTPEAIAFFNELMRGLPDRCPSCGFTHPSALWRRDGKSWQCMNCGTDPEWPTHIG